MDDYTYSTPLYKEIEARCVKEIQETVDKQILRDLLDEERWAIQAVEHAKPELKGLLRYRKLIRGVVVDAEGWPNGKPLGRYAGPVFLLEEDR